MNALRMIWIVSSNYNRDDRMVPLMERIAWELTERVQRVITIRYLFRLDTKTIREMTMEAKSMLDSWKSCYLNIRSVSSALATLYRNTL